MSNCSLVVTTLNSNHASSSSHKGTRAFCPVAVPPRAGLFLSRDVCNGLRRSQTPTISLLFSTQRDLVMPMHTITITTFGNAYRTSGAVALKVAGNPLRAAAQALLAAGHDPADLLRGVFDGASLSPVALHRLVRPYSPPRAAWGRTETPSALAPDQAVPGPSD
jgi:hypothetical protein